MKKWRDHYKRDWNTTEYGGHDRLSFIDWIIIIGMVILCGAIGAIIVLWTFNAEIRIEPKTAHAEMAEEQSDCKLLVCPPSETPIKMKTMASWYDYDLKGSPGYSKTNATAASRDFERGTNLLVCRTDATDVCVTVRVNDFGPDVTIHPDRGLDLSSYAFQQIAPLENGLVRIIIREVK